MRTLIRQYLDENLGRREFLRELAALGVSLSSAQMLLSSLSTAEADELSDEKIDEQVARVFSGNGTELLFETLEEAGVKYVFHGCGGGTNRFYDGILNRPSMKNFLGTNEGQCVAMAEGYHIASGGELGVAVIPRPGLTNAGGNIHNAMANRSSLIVLTAREDNQTSDRRGNIELVDWEEVINGLSKDMEREMDWFSPRNHA